MTLSTLAGKWRMELEWRVQFSNREYDRMLSNVVMELNSSDLQVWRF